jgi:hypothetical protein
MAGRWIGRLQLLSRKENMLQQLVNMSLEIKRHLFNAMGLLVFSGRDRDAIDVQGLAH